MTQTGIQMTALKNMKLCCSLIRSVKKTLLPDVQALYQNVKTRYLDPRGLLWNARNLRGKLPLATMGANQIAKLNVK